MGIPSYYKRLLENIPGLLTKHRPNPAVVLFLDFNCIIYHCARKPGGMRPFPSDWEEQRIWENDLNKNICSYIHKLWKEAGQPREILCAMDGVVPMAKIRQQRLRRFKSIWMAQEERLCGARTNEETWDTNCITPGTDYMKRLSIALSDFCKNMTSRGNGNWHLSSSDEPGEGEHKIMHWIRKPDFQPPPGAILIYGLDADLILLSMYNTFQNQERNPCFLFREDIEFGRVAMNSLGEESYSFFSIPKLIEAMWPGETPTLQRIKSYVAGMSFMGNDFLPHSLSVKIRDDGHLILLSELRELEKEGKTLLNSEDTGFCIDSLQRIFQKWSEKEADWIEKGFQKKRKVFPNDGGKRSTPEEAAASALQKKPIEWFVEKEAMENTNKLQMIPNWQTIYNEKWLGVFSSQDKQRVCVSYLQGLQWILSYYTGQNPVDMFWYYPWRLPPLWKDLAEFCQTNTYFDFTIPSSHLSPIQPKEQLAMVLPLESWHILREVDKKMSILPSLYPHMWPNHFELFSVGRRWLWECEPILPMLPISYVRKIEQMSERSLS
jgi:5'-3' exoribonuclease 1